MKVYRETTPYEFLHNDSWCCDYLQELITFEYENAFNALIEDSCGGEDMSETELNDMLRFDNEWILESLGISENNDDEDYDETEDE